jgi:hypothetical protein
MIEIRQLEICHNKKLFVVKVSEIIDLRQRTSKCHLIALWAEGVYILASYPPSKNIKHMFLGQ